MSKTVAKKGNQDSMVGAFLEEMTPRVPENMRPHYKKAIPYVVMAADLLDKLFPYLVMLWNYCWVAWEKCQPFHEYFPIVGGLVLCFFGGSYLVLVAAFEAYRLSAWGRTSKAFKVLRTNYLAAKAASQKDDKVDADGDGIADVKQITKKELLTRKVGVFMKSANPQEVSEALTCIWAGYLSVLATLKVKFATAVTLGCSIGDCMTRYVGAPIEKAIFDLLPPEQRKWAPVLTNYGLKWLGMTLAWMVQTVIAAFHSAVRGGTLFAESFIRALNKHGYVEGIDEHSFQATALAGITAFAGFYWQFSNGFALPFPLNVLCLPATILQWWVQFSVSMF